MRVAVISEFYPSLRDPVLGVWAHRQALAAREAGAEVEVLVLRRPVPGRNTLAGSPLHAVRALAAAAGEPLRQQHDGLSVRYVPYLSPPRWRSYPQWGAWAAAPLAAALGAMAARGGFDLIHAHNAVPAGDAARRALSMLPMLRAPLIVSVHGGDVLYTSRVFPTGAEAVRRGLAAARLTLANSAGIATLARSHGAGETRIVHLGGAGEGPDHARRGAGADEGPDDARRGGGAGERRGGGTGERHSGPAGGASTAGRARTGPAETGGGAPTLLTVAHLVARKRHADVIRALAVLSQRHPTLRYTIVGDGPERVALEGLAHRLGVSERVHMLGQLPPDEAIERARRCTLFVMPSTEEAFGVAYVEAMAAGAPAIGCRGEPGPEEIAAAGGGLVLVPPGDIERLSQRIDELISDRGRLREESRRARETVAANFTWRHCGQQTLAAYEAVLR